MNFLCFNRNAIFYYARALVRAFVASTVMSIPAIASNIPANVAEAQKQILDKNPSVRIEAAGILKSNRQPSTAKLLNQSLSREENPLVVMALLDALGSMPELAAIPPIAAKLSRDEVPVRKRAAYVLGLAGGPRAERVLSQALLRESNAEVKAILLQSLSVCGSEASVSVIKNAMRDSRPEVRAKAAETLEHIPGHSRRANGRRSAKK